MVFFFAMVTDAFAPAFVHAAPAFAVAVVVAVADEDAAATLRVPLPIVKFISWRPAEVAKYTLNTFEPGEVS